MAVCQSACLWLNHRYRGQAPSHIFNLIVSVTLKRPVLRRGYAGSSVYTRD